MKRSFRGPSRAIEWNVDRGVVRVECWAWNSPESKSTSPRRIGRPLNKEVKMNCSNTFVAAHRVLVNELRGALATKGLIKGGA